MRIGKQSKSAIQHSKEKVSRRAIGGQKVAIHEEKDCKVNRHLSFLTRKGKNDDMNFKPSLYIVKNHDCMLGVDRLDEAKQKFVQDSIGKAMA